MGYIITAEVDTTEDINACGDKSKVAARILSERSIPSYGGTGSVITFDVKGEFDPELRKNIVKKLCETLIDAGFISFRIGHSY